MPHDITGSGLNTGASYHIYEVPVQNKGTPTHEIHAYEEKDWKSVGLFTRMVARCLGRVTDQVIDGKKYVIVNTLYKKFKSNKDGEHLNSKQMELNIKAVVASLTPKEKEGPISPYPDIHLAPAPEGFNDVSLDNKPPTIAILKNWIEELSFPSTDAHKDTFKSILEYDRANVMALLKDDSKESGMLCKKLIEKIVKRDSTLGEWKPTREEASNYATIFGKNQDTFDDLWAKAFPAAPKK